MNGYRDSTGHADSHVGITLPQHRKPAFPPIQPPAMRPPSIPAGASVGPSGPSLPFLSFDLSSAGPTSFASPPAGVYGNQGFFEHEPPLLEELGINTAQILRKTRSILNPIRVNVDLHEDADLSGPFVNFMLFGLFQLLAGKLHFGVILGWLAIAALFLYTVFNLLAGRNGKLDLYRILSVVGYCLLPMVVFSALAVFIPRKGPSTTMIALVAILWCTRACTRLLVALTPDAEQHKALVGYACGLIYTAFSLLVLY